MSAHPAEKCPYCGEDRILLTVNEATEIASVNRKTIYRWIRTGALEHCILPSGAIRIFKDSLIRSPDGERTHAHPEAQAAEPQTLPTSERKPERAARPGARRPRPGSP
jgi:hypothetical protein